MSLLGYGKRGGGTAFICFLYLALTFNGLLAQPLSSMTRGVEDEFLRGVSAYESGDFESAAQSFQKAYLVHKNANLAFNTAMSFEKLGAREAAALWYETYRSLKNIDEVAIQGRINELNPSMAPAVPISAPPVVVVKEVSAYKATAFGTGVVGLVGASILGGMAMYYSERSNETANLKRQGVYARNAESFALTADITLLAAAAGLIYGSIDFF